MPFRTRPDQPRDLHALIEGEVRDRIADAVDSVSLDVMVRRRRGRRLPDPIADSASDREEFDAGVRAFLERLAAELARELSADQPGPAAAAATGGGAAAVARLIATQVTLARRLPDYWQRFDAIRLAFTGERCR